MITIVIIIINFRYLILINKIYLTHLKHNKKMLKGKQNHIKLKTNLHRFLYQLKNKSFKFL